VAEPWTYLREIARVLKPGGKILLDVPDREALKEAIEFKDRTHCAGEDWEIIVRWSFDEKTNRVHNETRFVLNGQPHDTGYDMRLYVREELEEELRRAGLAPWRFWNDLHRDAGDSPGERLVIAAIKDN